ncbi:ACT domain-containing protein [Caldivirga sp.]|uniref:ACT domain-containing protein n=1 Tax=Caldivirga sp. TaxID=2080243 RepID=UPI0025C04241|nr:ACT domain-containing protein [Caldivirga sp.]
MNNYKISITLLNNDGSVDPVVRALNVIRRGKVNVKSMLTYFNQNHVNVEVYVEGIEDEVNWVCNKLNKLYDVVNVSYSTSISIPKVQSLQVGERNG